MIDKIVTRHISPYHAWQGPESEAPVSPAGEAAIPRSLDGHPPRCATEGCDCYATTHFVRGGIGSYYCVDCYLKIQALTGDGS